MKAVIGAVAVALAAAAPAPAHYYDGCQKYTCKAHVIKPHNTHLNRIHNCEAKHVGWFKDGYFDGGLQFTVQTWQSLGSKFRYAFQAPIHEQKYRAVILAYRIGCWRCTQGWPNCG